VLDSSDHLNLKDAKSRNNKNVSQNCLNTLPVSGKKVMVMYLLVALKRATATLDVYAFVCMFMLMLSAKL